MNKIRVLIADDHAIVRMGLVALLNTDADIEVVGEAEDGLAAIERTCALHPDVIVMDLMMPVMDGATAIAAIRVKAPESKVLVLTTSTVSDDLSRALKAGAVGALTKSTTNERLLDIIKIIAKGERCIDPSITDIIKTDPPAPLLTDRQSEILSYVVRGFTNADIARCLGITVCSVKERLTSVYAKIGVANRAEAVALALKKHLLKM